MVAKRVIPCLDVRGHRTVKGVRFTDLRDAGDPVLLAQRYEEEGADELTLLDVEATLEGRATFLGVVQEVAKVVRIPFTVGGGVFSLDTARTLIHGGADKICVNSAALSRPALITELASEFGSQAVVVALDVRLQDNAWQIFSRSGTNSTGRVALDWCSEAVERGAGELLVTSIDHDGVRGGYALELIEAITQLVTVPVVASGGAGDEHDFVRVFGAGADAALAAGLFHFGELGIRALKQYLLEQGVPVRYE